MPEFATEFELMEKTEGFYKNIAQIRLVEEFDNIHTCMLSHFSSRWDLKKDLYAESIERNIKYLKSILNRVNGGASAITQKLRRGGIADTQPKGMKKDRA